MENFKDLQEQRWTPVYWLHDIKKDQFVANVASYSILLTLSCLVGKKDFGHYIIEFWWIFLQRTWICFTINVIHTFVYLLLLYIKLKKSSNCKCCYKGKLKYLFITTLPYFLLLLEDLKLFSYIFHIYYYISI